MINEINRANAIDKLAELIGVELFSISHVDAPNASILCTPRNAQAEKIHINCNDNNQTLTDYQTLKKDNPDKEFVLYL